jgi:hypothetical protein
LIDFDSILTDDGRLSLGRGDEMRTHCCRSMTEHLWNEPDDERLIVFSEAFNEYGLQDRKNNDAYTPICYCPWCGTKLPGRFEPDSPSSTQT